MNEKKSRYILMAEIVIICIFHTVKIMNSGHHAGHVASSNFSFLQFKKGNINIKIGARSKLYAH
jgi:hypothetical protein